MCIRDSFGILIDTGKRKGLLVRQSSRKDKHRLRLHARRTTNAIADQVNIAGSRWTIEECFEQPKQQTGLESTKFEAGIRGIDTARCRCSLI